MDDTDTSLAEVLADVNADLRRCDWLAALGDETQRKIIALMLFAADHPDWAWIQFYTHLGRMTLRASRSSAASRSQTSGDCSS